MHNFPTERTMKIVIRGVLMGLSEKEIVEEQVKNSFEIDLVKRFEPKDKPIPIVLVVLKRCSISANIYKLLTIFYT